MESLLSSSSLKIVENFLLLIVLSKSLETILPLLLLLQKFLEGLSVFILFLLKFSEKLLILFYWNF